MKNLADEVMRTAVIAVAAAEMLNWAWTTIRPLLWLVVILAVVVGFLRFQRR